MHDFDNNTKLDGLEIFKALTHLLPYEPEDEEKYKASHNKGLSKDELDALRRSDELEYYTGMRLCSALCTSFKRGSLSSDRVLTLHKKCSCEITQ